MLVFILWVEGLGEVVEECIRADREDRGFVFYLGMVGRV